MDSSPQDEESRLSKTKIHSLSVADLKEACKVRKISQTGNKSVLQKRLVKHESSVGKSISLDDSKSDDSDTDSQPSASTRQIARKRPAPDSTHAGTHQQ